MMEYRSIWHHFHGCTPPPWTVMWLCLFLHLAAIGSLTGLLRQPFSASHGAYNFMQPVSHGALTQVCAALPCSVSRTAYMIRKANGTRGRQKPLAKKISSALNNLYLYLYLYLHTSTTFRHSTGTS